MGENFNKIKLNLGKPENGWLPVGFKTKDFELNFYCSNIPDNPTEKLCEILTLALNNFESKMRWNLEPEFIDFRITPIGQKFRLEISKSVSGINLESKVFELTTDFDSIILPIYRTLKKFNSYDYEKKDWVKTDQTKIDKLAKLINDKKNGLQQRVYCIASDFPFGKYSQTQW